MASREGYGIWHFALGYLRYLLVSRSSSSVHSPYVFNWAQNVLGSSNGIKAFHSIETCRSRLKSNKRLIRPEVIDAPQRTVGQIVRSAAKHPKYCRLLSHIVSYSHPHTVIELGTSLGVSSAYIATALDPDVRFVSIEGEPEIHSIAKENLRSLDLKANLRCGLFIDVLPDILEEFKRVDLIFIDGHHDYDATMEYFQTALPYCHTGSVLIFDDINWSAGMQRAWKRIQSHKRVSQTVDLYTMGIAFLREGVAEEHFVLRY